MHPKHKHKKCPKNKKSDGSTKSADFTPHSSLNVNSYSSQTTDKSTSSNPHRDNTNISKYVRTVISDVTVGSNRSLFRPAALIVQTNNSRILTMGENICFSIGMVDNDLTPLITVNESGTVFTFVDDGVYRFEMDGVITSIDSDCITLSIVSEEFRSELHAFTKSILYNLKLQTQSGMHISTMLPIVPKQKITFQFEGNNTNNKVILHQNSRLQIYRIA